MRRRMPRVTITALCAVMLALTGAGIASAAFTETGTLGTGPGSGAGQLDGPINVDVGPDGSVYVVDSVNQRIVKFGPGGAFERTWGKDVTVGGGTGFEVCTTVCKAGVGGSAAGETQGVEGVAVSPDGLAVYVTDDGNRRVSQHAPDGTFVRAWGRDVTPGGGTEFEICTASCKAGIDGEEGGDLRRPSGIAVAPSGDVYVTETINDRISQFTATGDFVRVFGRDVDSGGGSGFETCTTTCQGGATGDPAGVTVTGAGEVYVASPGEDYVIRFSAEGAFLGTFAGEGSGAATITNPESIDVNAAGEVLVTQSADSFLIFRFLAGPTFLETFSTGPTFNDGATDVAFGNDDGAYVANRSKDRVVRYALSAGPGPPPVVPPPAPAPPPAPVPAPVPVKPPPLAALPKAAAVIVLPSARKCVSRRNFRIRLKQPKGFKLKSATVNLNGRRVATRSGKRVTAPVDLRGLPKGRFTVKIAVTLTDGRKVTNTRKYRTCAPKRR